MLDLLNPDVKNNILFSFSLPFNHYFHLEVDNRGCLRLFILNFNQYLPYKNSKFYISSSSYHKYFIIKILNYRFKVKDKNNV